MCGGVGFKIKNIPEKELSKYFSQELIKRFKTTGEVESFFWHKDAVLPVKTNAGVQLKIWGNKDEEVKLPKTGWAKIESLKAGKWDHLHPETLDIPIEKGYEKKVWFDMPEGTKGILVQKGGKERVYMITEEADDNYKNKTKHERQPLGRKVF